MAENLDLCIHEADLARTMNTVRPMVGLAMAGFSVMVEAAAQMNQAGKARSMFDSTVARELETVNDTTARIMTHQAEVESVSHMIEMPGCPDGRTACAETCQKLGMAVRLKELLDNPPRLDPGLGKGF